MNDHDRIIRLEERMVAHDQALDLAREVLNERISRLNEFRAALADAQATMITHAEVDLLMGAMNQRVRSLEQGDAGQAGRVAGIQWIIATLIVVAGLVIAAIVAFK